MTGQAVGAALIGALGEVIAPGQAIAVSGAVGILVALALVRVLRPAPAQVTAQPSPKRA
jgi:hypothetical protein